MEANCTVCGNEYPARKGKLYCSDACKQKAYMGRKTGDPVTLRPSKREQAFFDMDEYKKWVDKYGSHLDFSQYCFFRKNLPAAFTVEMIDDYLNSIWSDSLINRLNNPNTAIGKEFEGFEVKFYSGAFEIRNTVKIEEVGQQ